jgi:hypothetical protein
LNKFEDKADSDFKSYDCSILALLILCWHKCISEWNGYDDQDSLVVEAALIALAYSHHVTPWFCVISWFGSLPSGNPLTAILNSLVQQLLFRYSFAKTFGMNQVKFFLRYVYLCSYGDDGVRSVSRLISNKWTPEMVSQHFSELGMTITAGNKQGVGSYVELEDIGFLKRTFKFDSTLMRYIGPLDVSSIDKMVNWSKSGDKYLEIMGTNLEKAILETCFHGKEVYEKYRLTLFPIAIDRGVKIPHISSWRHGLDLNASRLPEFWQIEDGLIL